MERGLSPEKEETISTMAKKKQKLELTWIGKDKRPKLEPRILIEDPEKSYHAQERRSEKDIFDNILIHGDNLLALKALEQNYAGKIKCIFIDPPYNTFSAIPNYPDGIEHSLWLSLMYERLQIMRDLLAENGSIWITIDDNEAHYLKVISDEIFGRANFIGSVVWQHSVQGKNDAKGLSLHHNYLLCYRRSDHFKIGRVPRSEEHNKNYSHPDRDPKGLWRSGDVRSPHPRPNLRYDVITPSGGVIPPPENGWRWAESSFWEKVETGEISFVNDETRVLRKIYLCDQPGRVPESIWFGDDVGTTREATRDLKEAIKGTSDLFPTPKPERLVERILTLTTQPGDLVLDSFAGSGTTGAVAHKMKRKWIMIELGDHCDSNILPRLHKIIEGNDSSGITSDVDWRGGGGFRYFRLAPSLLERDTYGNWVISKEYKPEMLAEAICKHMGFVYAPSQNPDEYWNHGYSTETDFIFVTTQNLTKAALTKISEDVGPDRTLLICCKAFRANSDAFENLTIKKIPHAVLQKCEWGHDDYSLNVANLPMAAPNEEDEPPASLPPDDLPLFAPEEEQAEA